MVRTRDYFLLLLTIAFLVVGIGATVADSYRKGGLFDTSRPLQFVEDGDIERTATVLDTESIDRAERLATLREKIAAGGLLSLAPPRSEPVSAATTSDAITEAPSEGQIELRCGNYRAFSGSWPQKILLEEVEGARIVYVENTSTNAVPQTSASTTVPYVPSRDVLAELPVRSASLGAQNCIQSDVIGIARDGSLIRNNNVAAYAIFGSETLLGYALDGYPIHGSGTSVTDSCGGLTVGGQYRYQISGDRQTIINCYSGVPVQL